MKNKILLGTAFMATLLLGVVGCKKPSDGVEPIIGLETFTNRVNVILIDASTGAQMGLDDDSYTVNIEVTGPDKNLVYDELGEDQPTSKGGFAFMTIKDASIPTPSNPIEFNLIFKRSGYLNQVVPVRLFKEGTQAMEVRMINLSDLPAGVAHISNNSISSNAQGVTAAEVIIETPTPMTTGEQTKAVVTVPAGTKLMDANMNPVSGTITSTFTYFSNTEESSVSAFPGGLQAETSEGSGLFSTGGLITLDMFSSNGTEVTNFDNPISMTMEIPASTLNDQGSPLSAGDIFPVWSLNEETGVWQKEADATVTLNSTTQKLEATFDMAHLSSWNLDILYPGCGRKTINVISNISGSSFATAAVYRVVGGTREPGGSVYASVQNGSSFTLNYVPQNDPLELDFYNDDFTVLQTVTLNAGCGTETIDLTLGEPEKIKVNVLIKCGEFVFPFSGPVYYKKASESVWKYGGEMVNNVFDSQVFYYNVPYNIRVNGRDGGTFTADSPVETKVIQLCP